MLKIKTFTFNPFQENTYLLINEQNEGILIDPGCYEPYEQKELLDFLNAEKITLKLNFTQMSFKPLKFRIF